MSAGEMFLVLLLLLAIAGAAIWLYERRRASRLRRRFGAEYDATVRRHGRWSGEQELERRERKLRRLDIRPLSREDQLAFSSEWRAVQAKFVDDPGVATHEADNLVTRVMQARGYNPGDFEQRVADLSVEHGRVIDRYRRAHALALRHRQGTASTEDLRNAVVDYRALFEELLGERVRTAGRSEVTGD